MLGTSTLFNADLDAGWRLAAFPLSVSATADLLADARRPARLDFRTAVDRSPGDLRRGPDGRTCARLDGLVDLAGLEADFDLATAARDLRYWPPAFLRRTTIDFADRDLALATSGRLGANSDRDRPDLEDDCDATLDVDLDLVVSRASLHRL